MALHQLLTIESSGKLVAQKFEDLNADIVLVGKRTIYNRMLAIKMRMRKRGDSITYPVKWDSVKQRRAFFATNGFGGGIPYRRTNKRPEGFEVSAIENGYKLANKQKGAPFLYGDVRGVHQSRIHRGRWLVFRTVVNEELAKLPKEVLHGFTYRSRAG